MTPTPHPDELAADLAARADDPAALTRRWLLQQSTATLCTTAVHREVEGFPFGSVVPFALDARGRPFILIAHIAAHTANLKADPRASLFVRQPDVRGDPQAGWRVTVLGRLERMPDDHEERAELHARYAARVPRVDVYEETHGFAFWRMTEIAKVRYIAGFGKICWFGGSELLREPAGGGIGEVAPGAVAHMNEDHGHNLLEMCRGHYGVDPARATMTKLEADGFFVRTEGPGRTLFFPFGEAIEGRDVRRAVIDVLKRARQGAAPPG